MSDPRCPVRACMAPIGPLSWFCCDAHWLSLSVRLREKVEQTVHDMYDSGGTYPGAVEWERVQQEALQWAYEMGE